MKKNYYTVFFASERNKYSRSVQISKITIIIFMFFGIILIGLAIVGGLRIANKDPLSRELRNLKDDRYLLQNILSDLKISNDLDSTNAYEKFIAEFQLNHKLSIPGSPPVDGYITRGMNRENNHLGVDIAAKYQDEISAPADGRVIFSGKNEDLGNTIIISHPGGFVTLYGHNDTNLVIAGKEIYKGQVVARVGETGKSQGPHLHFEIWKNNQVLDPRELIPKYKEKDVSIR